MRFRKSFSAVCYHFGRDAVRPKRAETTLQKYNIFFNSQVFLEQIRQSIPTPENRELKAKMAELAQLDERDAR